MSQEVDASPTASTAPEDTELARTRQQVVELEARLEALTGEVVEARHDRLTVRDHVIGVQAEAATHRYDNLQLKRRSKRLARRVEELKGLLKNERAANRQMRRLLDDVRTRAELREQELAALKRSRTWRAGRVVVAPFSIFKR
jgi:predicted  nucleic acid-binding Zn-ribbon protein